MGEFDNLQMTEREDRLRLIICHSLSESIQKGLSGVVFESACNRVHAALDKDRESRGKEISEMRQDNKDWHEKIESKFNSIYWFIVITLISSVGALFMKIIEKVK